MEINWFLPTGGTDGRYLGTTLGGRVADFDYLQQVAHARDPPGRSKARVLVAALPLPSPLPKEPL